MSRPCYASWSSAWHSWVSDPMMINVLEVVLSLFQLQVGDSERTGTAAFLFGRFSFKRNCVAH